MALVNSENNSFNLAEEPSIHSDGPAIAALNTSLIDYKFVGDEDVYGPAFVENLEQAEYHIAGNFQYPINTLDNSAEYITHQIEPP